MVNEVRALSVILAIIILSSALALANEDSLLYSDMAKLNVKIQADMNLESIDEGYYTNYVRADLSYIPGEYAFQKVLSMKTTPTPQNVDGVLRFEWTNPEPGDLALKLDSVVKTYHHLAEIKDRIEFPLNKKTLPLPIREYTLPSEHIDSDDPAINKLASELAEGEDDLYVVVFNVAKWVMKNLRYDISVSRRVESASWVLENKRGVCDEFSTLFIGLVRSLGIPAKYISGIAYSNVDLIQGFGPHAWVEVYFPNYGWVPFDFTYAELGYIDPSHVKLKESMDPGESSTKYEWEGYLVRLNTDPLDIKTEMLGQGSRVGQLVELEVNVEKPIVGFGSYNLIKVKVSNNNDFYVPTAIQLSRTDGIILDNDRKFILLPPNSEGELSWTLRVREDLDKDFIYTFKIGAYTSLNYSSEGTFQAKYAEPVYSLEEIQDLVESQKEESDKHYSSKVDLECYPFTNKIYVNTSTLVDCNIDNKGNIFLNNLSVCLEDDCQIIQLGIGQSELVEFSRKFVEDKKEDLLVKVSNDKVTRTDFVVIDVQNKPIINIENVTYPIAVNRNDTFTIEFAVRKYSRSQPQNLKVVLKSGQQQKMWKINDLDNDRKFIINLRGSDLSKKENNFTIKATYSDLNGDLLSKQSSFSITLNNPSIVNSMTAFTDKILEIVDWRILALSAIVFGAILGLVFPKKKKELW